MCREAGRRSSPHPHHLPLPSLPRSDRPECEIVRGINERADQRLDISGHLFNCNIHLQGDAMQRLLVYVDAALIRWAERTGRYAVLEPLRKIARRPSLQTRLIG